MRLFLRETGKRTWRFTGKGTEIHTVFEHTNQKGLISLSIPPLHWDFHVVDVRQRHFQLPVEGRAWAQSSFNTDREPCKSYWLNPGIKPHP